MIIYLKQAVLLTFFFALPGCLFWPPKTFVTADVYLNEQNQAVFSYDDAIKGERSFRRDRYLFSAITVKEETCQLAECVRIIWEVSNDAVYSKKRLHRNHQLPEYIVYGQDFSKANVEISPEHLKLNTPYLVRVGVIGIDDNQEDEIPFTAETYFLLKKDKGGKLKVETTTIRPTLLKWQDEFLRTKEAKELRFSN